METSLGLCEECNADFLAKPRFKSVHSPFLNSDEQTGHKRILETDGYDSRERI